VTEGRASGETSEMFAERLLLVIDEGRRTATYKLALLLALIDGCAAHAGPDGRAPEVLHTRTIAEHVLRLYFPQARAYLGPDGEALHLDQITLRRSAMFAAILRLHLLADAERCRGITQVAARLPEDYEPPSTRSRRPSPATPCGCCRSSAASTDRSSTTSTGPTR
jgi:hypothetical protein